MKGRASLDLTGKTFGRWTVVVRVSPRGARAIRWLCRCDCGSEKEVAASSLIKGDSKSCGCLASEVTAARNVASARHGHGTKTPSPTYITWQAMVRRCTNPTTIAERRYYLQRGITVCDRWRSFEVFLADMGERPEGKTIDRIDNARGYEPGNCRWATPKEQAANRRRQVPRGTWKGRAA